MRTLREYKVLIQTLKQQGTLRIYIRYLVKRHKAAVAYVFLTAALMLALHASNQRNIHDLERTIKLRCEASNDFKRNTNYQFEKQQEINRTGTYLFSKAGRLLQEQGGGDFKKLGKEFTYTAYTYAYLGSRFEDVPLENCDRVEVPPEEG